MSESVGRLRASFAEFDWLAAVQVAACLKWWRAQVCHLGSAETFPLSVVIHQGRACVGLDELAKFLDAECAPMPIGDGRQGGDLLLARLFQAELRAEIYRLELNRALESLVRITEELAVDPEAVDERCLSQFELAKSVLKAQARALVSGLSDLVLNTTPPEQPLASIERGEPESMPPSAAT